MGMRKQSRRVWKVGGAVVVVEMERKGSEEGGAL
jgi:hypothetical protein